MFDETAPPAQMQRVDGRAGATIGPGGRLGRLWQKGSAKAMLPRMHGRAPEVVFLNTAGGITGGDRLAYTLDVAAGAAAVGTTQTAERAYRSAGGVARVEARLSVGAGGRLHWLPQEMILFDGAAVDRRVTVEMAGDAELVLLETLVLGRAAMGERLADLQLTDRREVIRDGRPAMVEAIRLGPADLLRPGAAGLGGAVAVATLSLFAPDAEDRLDRLRAALPSDGPVRAAASAWDGRVVARFAAPEAWPLRRAVARAVEALTDGPLPRVWQI
ncbi:urease accessory protein UreD [Roseicyclus persicicus]|uniref:Urease accessory protein UreD n=1 Tax=Roseicyclus persicicus TaxID=2650661 RepID=A0A7X6H0U1_9RHOB|nr:urease accessory protein UreD [Roseibacterium persicicum]NKX45875.1 urease accessory protein UreD [Roseibacterium persicicum]